MELFRKDCTIFNSLYRFTKYELDVLTRFAKYSQIKIAI